MITEEQHYQLEEVTVFVDDGTWELIASPVPDPDDHQYGAYTVWVNYCEENYRGEMQSLGSASLSCLEWRGVVELLGNESEDGEYEVKVPSYVMRAAQRLEDKVHEESEAA